MHKIKAAMETGDRETAQELKKQLRGMYKENVGDLKENRQGMREKWQESKSDRKES